MSRLPKCLSNEPPNALSCWSEHLHSLSRVSKIVVFFYLLITHKQDSNNNNKIQSEFKSFYTRLSGSVFRLPHNSRIPNKLKSMHTIDTLSKRLIPDSIKIFHSNDVDFVGVSEVISVLRTDNSIVFTRVLQVVCFVWSNTHKFICKNERHKRGNIFQRHNDNRNQRDLWLLAPYQFCE